MLPGQCLGVKDLEEEEWPTETRIAQKLSTSYENICD